MAFDQRAAWAMGIATTVAVAGGALWQRHRETQAEAHTPARKLFVVGVLSGVHAVDLATGKGGKGIVTGILPHNLALAPDGKRLWVTNVGSQSVSAIDVATERKVQDILVGEMPDNPAHRKLGAERLARATSCYECHDRFAIGSLPNALAFDSSGRYLMVNELRRRSVTWLDVAAGKTVRAVTFPDLPPQAAPANMVVHPRRGEVWVLHRFEPEDKTYDPRARGGPAEAGPSPGTGRLSASQKDDFQHDAPLGVKRSWVTVHDATMNQRLATIEIGQTVPFDGVFSRDGRLLYVGYRSTNQIAVFDTATRTLARWIETGSAPTGLSLSPDGKQLYVTCLHAKPPVVQVINAASGAVEASLGVHPSPSLVVTDRATGLIYVTATGYNAVLEIDPVNRKLLRELPAGHQPLALTLTR
ncbi:MAG: YncE family protein [Candidatus Sericytochromatia bacterium]|nr:YncE family protein [Candidatus Sericytochromatia bacterium]